MVLNILLKNLWIIKGFIAFFPLARIIVSHFFRTTSDKAVISNAQSKLKENVEKIVLINHCSMETQLHSSSNSRCIKSRQDSYVIITENVDFQLWVEANTEAGRSTYALRPGTCTILHSHDHFTSKSCNLSHLFSTSFA